MTACLKGTGFAILPVVIARASPGNPVIRWRFLDAPGLRRGMTGEESVI